MRRVVALVTLAAALTVPWVAVRADPPPALSHNPFSRPALADRVSVADNGAPAPLDAAELPLRATLNAGAQSLANVGGELLAVGDEYQGWRLIAIGEGEAQFAFGKKRITVPVTGNDKERQNVRKPRS